MSTNTAARSSDQATADDEKGSNVQVLLRIRPNSDLERKTNAMNIISAISQTEISVELSKRQMSSPDKMFTFDRVYAPTTNQEQVFTDTVEPMLDEVLNGYNSTIFAYGQTGTGKTYTMEGSLTQGDRDAGIIPRCVHALFDRLHQDHAEFTVKVSFLELYNEDLSDLLSDDPTKQLRIYEDKEKSMFVQNLDEILVSSPQEVFELLRKSQQRRRVAETNLNKHSSRSHYVFTLVVHIKDVVDNEELFKTGKLHLVDLAGSENIGRSGAQNQRAVEAGKINQSLLALGRVITALVERQLFIPYRDSKLTRLLQESLGGRSKTIIIATISPAVSCIEESLSTLEYANRAKNIKNKPQVNMKLTKKAYFRDLVLEIRRLKAQNEALRSQNGIYLPPDQYAELTDGYNAQKQELEDTQAELMLKQRELVDMLTVFQVNDDIFHQVLGEYTSNVHRLKETRQKLFDAKLELYTTSKSLDETTHVKEQLKHVEGILLDESQRLQTTVKDMLVDNDGLFARIDRQALHEQKQITTVHKFKDVMLDLVGETCDTLNSANLTISTFNDTAKGQLNEYQQHVQQHSRDMVIHINAQQQHVGALEKDYSVSTQQLLITGKEACGAFKTSMDDAIHALNALRTTAATSRADYVQTISAGADHVTSQHMNTLDQLTQLVASQTSSQTENVQSLHSTIHGGLAKSKECRSSYTSKSDTMDHNSIENEMNILAASKDAYKQRTAALEAHHDDLVGFHSSSTQSLQSSHSWRSKAHSALLKDIVSFDGYLASYHDQQIATNNSHVEDSLHQLQALSSTHKQQYEEASSHVNTMLDHRTQWSEETHNNLTSCQTRLQHWNQEQAEKHTDLTSTLSDNEELFTSVIGTLMNNFATTEQALTSHLNSQTTQLLTTITSLIESFKTSQTELLSKKMQQLVDYSKKEIDNRLDEHFTTINQKVEDNHQHQQEFVTAETKHMQAWSLNATKYDTSSDESYQQLQTHLGQIEETTCDHIGHLTSTIHTNSEQVVKSVETSRAHCTKDLQLKQGQVKSIEAHNNTFNTTMREMLNANKTSMETWCETTHKTYDSEQATCETQHDARLAAIEAKKALLHQQYLKQLDAIEQEYAEACNAHITSINRSTATLNTTVSTATSAMQSAHKQWHDEFSATTAEWVEASTSQDCDIDTHVQSKVMDPTTEHTIHLEQHYGQLGEISSTFHDQLASAMQAGGSRLEATVVDGEQSALKTIHGLNQSVSLVASATLGHLDSINQIEANKTERTTSLVTHDIYSYPPTGATPLKKQWDYPAISTKSRPEDAILQDYRSRREVQGFAEGIPFVIDEEHGSAGGQDEDECDDNGRLLRSSHNIEENKMIPDLSTPRLHRKWASTTKPLAHSIRFPHINEEDPSYEAVADAKQKKLSELVGIESIVCDYDSPLLSIQPYPYRAVQRDEITGVVPGASSLAILPQAPLPLSAMVATAEPERSLSSPQSVSSHASNDTSSVSSLTASPDVVNPTQFNVDRMPTPSNDHPPTSMQMDTAPSGLNQHSNHALPDTSTSSLLSVSIPQDENSPYNDVQVSCLTPHVTRRKTGSSNSTISATMPQQTLFPSDAIDEDISNLQTVNGMPFVSLPDDTSPVERVLPSSALTPKTSSDRSTPRHVPSQTFVPPIQSRSVIPPAPTTNSVQQPPSQAPPVRGPRPVPTNRINSRPGQVPGPDDKLSRGISAPVSRPPGAVARQAQTAPVGRPTIASNAAPTVQRRPAGSTAQPQQRPIQRMGAVPPGRRPPPSGSN